MRVIDKFKAIFLWFEWIVVRGLDHSWVQCCYGSVKSTVIIILSSLHCMCGNRCGLDDVKTVMLKRSKIFFGKVMLVDEKFYIVSLKTQIYSCLIFKNLILYGLCNY